MTSKYRVVLASTVGEEDGIAVELHGDPSASAPDGVICELFRDDIGENHVFRTHGAVEVPIADFREFVRSAMRQFPDLWNDLQE